MREELQKIRDAALADLASSPEEAAIEAVRVRYLGRNRVLYQPLLLHGLPPSDEDAAAALFAHVAEHPDPIPEVDLVANSSPPPPGPRS